MRGNNTKRYLNPKRTKYEGGSEDPPFFVFIVKPVITYTPTQERGYRFSLLSNERLTVPAVVCLGRGY